MNNATNATSPSTPKPLVWLGRILSLLVIAAFTMSAIMKFRGGPELDQGLEHMGLPTSMVFPLAILELACVIIYAIPVTSIVGAILLTGYMGGAICTHWRVGDPFYTQIAIGVCVWLGIYLRDHRLWRLIPFRIISD